MKTVIENTTTLKLNKKEALWLKALVQNPIGCSSIRDDVIQHELDRSNELQSDKEMRRKFWDALIDVR